MNPSTKVLVLRYIPRLHFSHLLPHCLHLSLRTSLVSTSFALHMPHIGMRWVPPHDPNRPHCPYRPGFTTQIRQHTPPSPFGGPNYPPDVRPRAESTLLKTSTHTALVLANPPLETEPPQHIEWRSFTVLDSIAIGNARGAQVVACSVLRPGQPELKAVAKIYDALYYPRADSFAGVPIDPTHKADADYSREANAYQVLRSKGFTGSFVPDYYDSWTFEIAVPLADGKERQRSVRMVLIEHLDGCSLLNLYVQNNPTVSGQYDASHLDEGLRLEVMAQLMDGLARQRQAGITQKDVAPRNIVLVPSPHKHIGLSGGDKPRVVLIDYNNALIRGMLKREYQTRWDRDLPINPAELWWDETMPAMGGWMPSWWFDKDQKARRTWLLDNFMGATQGNYQPIEEELNMEPNQEPVRDNCD